MGESAIHALLAMQKVEGSNPFSRSREGLYLQALLVLPVGLCVCIAGADCGLARRFTRGSACKAKVCRHLVTVGA